MKFNHQVIEKKWQKRWDDERVFRIGQPKPGKKFYILDMFPYPSAAGLHVGHPKGYTATDIVARKRRMEGYEVLYPMGWDAFGLPTENFAVKVGRNPKEVAAENIKNFRRQVKSLGFSYDWSREIDTSSPAYYRWTQWLFLQLYKKGLAYRAKANVNYCPSCRTVLANEQVLDGKCERCGNPVTLRELEQWFFKITEYADRLLAGLEKIDWPERIKSMQRNWIGRAQGGEGNFRGLRKDATEKSRGAKMKIREGEFDVPVFTTRADTLLGVTAVVLSPEHPLVDSLVSASERKAVEAYRREVRDKSELERTGLKKEKTGVPLGTAAIHPLSGEQVPVWIAEYVLMGYGTGAVMMVPAHDERDFVFAKRYGLDMKFVISPPHEVSEARHEAIHHGKKRKGQDGAYTGEGILVNSGEYSGLTSVDARQKIAAALESAGRGRRQVNYHLRDWLVSRQRYWGAPIPIIYCQSCGEVPVPEKDLPVTLPDDVDFRPTGESPLSSSKSFHDVSCPKCDKPARRESDTMDTFVDSSWYFLRYTSPNEKRRPFDPRAASVWCPVDLYVGGAEHAVLHLLYARFVTMALHDLDQISFEEPMSRLRSVGLVLGEDGAKMSKSRGNVVNPDEVVEEFGADTMRLFEMFGGEFSETLQWSTKGIVGVRRFLERVAALGERAEESEAPPPDLPGRQAGAETLRLLHQTIKKVGDDIEAFKFNTAVSAMMILVNHLSARGSVSPDVFETFLKLLHPFAPHIAEELWERLGHSDLLAREKWPVFDPGLAREEQMTVVVQINGKVRETLRLPSDVSEDEVRAAALASLKVRKWLEGKEPKAVRYVPGRLISIVSG